MNIDKHWNDAFFSILWSVSPFHFIKFHLNPTPHLLASPAPPGQALPLSICLHRPPPPFSPIPRPRQSGSLVQQAPKFPASFLGNCLREMGLQKWTKAAPSLEDKWPFSHSPLRSYLLPLKVCTSVCPPPTILSTRMLRNCLSNEVKNEDWLVFWLYNTDTHVNH